MKDKVRYERLGRSGPCNVPECGHCGKRKQIRRVVTDETLLSYICHRCNMRLERWATRLVHKMRSAGTLNYKV